MLVVDVTLYPAQFMISIYTKKSEEIKVKMPFLQSAFPFVSHWNTCLHCLSDYNVLRMVLFICGWVSV